MADKKIPEINAGSMADIAFLLLVFFLVTTTIQSDAGLFQQLPQWVEDMEQDPKPKNERNVLQAIVTSSNQLILKMGKDGSQLNYEIDNLKERCIDFLTNNDRNPNWSEKMTKAVILIQNDNGTSYETYLKVMNQIQAAYNTICEQASKEKHGVSYEALNEDQKLEIREAFPKVVSEAEATKFGKDK